LNFLETPAAVHFMHRTLGWLVAFGALALWALVRVHRPKLPRAVRIPAMAASHLALMQFALGIATVVTHVQLPIAVAHQLCGAALAAALTWTALSTRENTEPRIQGVA